MWTLPVLVILGCALLSIPLGRYMAWAMADEGRGLPGKLDRFVSRLGGGRCGEAQSWHRYALSMLVFNAVMFEVVFIIFTTQTALPLNPDGKENMSADLAFNTAASFTSNTNLQHYSGEQQLSCFSQLFAIMWLQFVSAATGIAALTALCRGPAGKPAVGNFYCDLSRATVLVLLPLAAIVAVGLVLCGTPMTLRGSAVATTLEGLTQTISRGPVAARSFSPGTPATNASSWISCSGTASNTASTDSTMSGLQASSISSTVLSLKRDARRAPSEIREVLVGFQRILYLPAEAR